MGEGQWKVTEMLSRSNAHVSGVAQGQEQNQGDPGSRWEMMGVLQRDRVQGVSVLKVGQAGLIDGLHVGGRKGDSRMTPRFLAELLGRWWCRLQRWGNEVFRLRTDIRLLCKHRPPGQELGDWLCGAHPGKWARHPRDPFWLNK